MLKTGRTKMRGAHSQKRMEKEMMIGLSTSWWLQTFLCHQNVIWKNTLMNNKTLLISLGLIERCNAQKNSIWKVSQASVPACCCCGCYRPWGGDLCPPYPASVVGAPAALVPPPDPGSWRLGWWSTPWDMSELGWGRPLGGEERAHPEEQKTSVWKKTKYFEMVFQE